MTPDEQKLLADLAARISQTPPLNRDPDADAFIRTHIGNRPDALYLMTQTVLLQNAALEHARAEVDQAHAQVQQLQQQVGGGAIAPAGGSFLGGAAAQQGYRQSSFQSPFQPAAPQPAAPQPASGYQQGGFAPPPPAYGAPTQQPGGGFLRSAAQTAAGVAGGMLAFQGVEALLGGLTHGFGGFGGGSGFGGPRETIIENNYYGDSERESGRRFESSGGDSFLGPDSNVDYSKASNDIEPSDDNSNDDSSNDDTSSDDFSGDDDSGSDNF